LQENIRDLEEQLKHVDSKIERHSENICSLMRQPEGVRMVELASSLIQDAPWLLKSIASWDGEGVVFLHREVTSLCVNANDPIHDVSGFARPPGPSLVCHCSAMAGSSLSQFSMFARKAVASVPVLGRVSGIDMEAIEMSASQLKFRGSEPSTKSDWCIVVKALERAHALHLFERDVWRVHQQREGWPEIDFSCHKELTNLQQLLDRAIQFQVLVKQLNVKEQVEAAAECRLLDATRNKISSQIQQLAEDLADASVVRELSQSFSPEAQSALIQFSQIAGKAKFARSSQASKMTQRQLRRRQEYLDSFNRCSRFIPCWVLTTSQINNYLAPECIFDLIVIDEASQSDVTVLPGMVSQFLQSLLTFHPLLGAYNVFTFLCLSEFSRQNQGHRVAGSALEVVFPSSGVVSSPTFPIVDSQNTYEVPYSADAKGYQ